jgi:hypothetical protein
MTESSIHIEAAAEADINALCDELLLATRNISPPLHANRMLERLEVSHRELDLSNPDLLADLAARASQPAPSIVNILGRLRIEALWLPDIQTILTDTNLPSVKKRWALLHDMAHRVIPWHREYFLGDTASTLDPMCSATLEAEANYGASVLLFGGSHFSYKVRQLKPSWESLKNISKYYGSSLTAALLRFVSAGPDIPMLGMVTQPWWNRASPTETRVLKHTAFSPRWMSLVGPVDLAPIERQVRASLKRRRRGPLGSLEMTIEGNDGHAHVVHVESFFTSYNVLSMVTHTRLLFRSSPWPKPAVTRRHIHLT